MEFRRALILSVVLVAVPVTGTALAATGRSEAVRPAAHSRAATADVRRCVRDLFGGRAQCRRKADRTPPKGPRDVTVTGMTATSVTLSWSPGKGNKGVVSYGLYRDGTLVGSTPNTVGTISALTCGQTYKIGVDAVDAAGNRSKGQTTVNARTAACPVDHAAPKAPRDVSVTATTATSVSLSWTPAKDNKGVVSYGLYRDGTLVGSTSNTFATIGPLSCERTYTLGVDSVDAAGNRSKEQATVTATTAACPDTTPPTAPSDLTVTGSDATSITIVWTASRDNVGVIRYDLFLDGVAAGSSDHPGASFAGLHCGERHTLGVEAVDAAGNRSVRATLSAATAGCAADLFVSPHGADYRWSFIAATYDGAAVRLYVNGALAATTDVTGSMTPSDGPLRIGGNSIWHEWFAGKIDNVRIYNRALPGAEVGADMSSPVTAASPAPSSSGLVAAYSFDEGSGSTVADASGHGNTGVLANAVWAAGGRFGGALSFDGTDSLVTVAESSSLDLTSKMTLEAWVRPNELGGMWRTALLKEAGDHLDYALYANATDPADPNAKIGTPSGHVFVGTDTSAKAPNPLAASDCRAADDPCLTINQAYHAAQGGQTVGLEPGDYLEQSIQDDPAKTGPRVIVRPLPSGAVTVGGLEVHAKHLEFRDLNLGTTFWETWVEADDDVFANVIAGGFTINSSSNVSVLGGSYGPTVDHFAQVAPWPLDVEPKNITIDGVRFHDMTRATPSQHMQCLEFGAGDGIVVRNSRFTNCNDFDLMIAGWGNVPAPHNIVVENNFLDTATEAIPGFTAYYSLMTSGYDNTLIRNNSSTMPFALQPDGPWTNVRVVGNVAPMTPWLCKAGAVYSHNVWDGATCGPTDVNAPSGFVDPAHFDLHLAPGSAAINAGDPANYPPTDIDGQRRPIGPAPDAGADERG